jgi:hypothetical protein
LRQIHCMSAKTNTTRRIPSDDIEIDSDNDGIDFDSDNNDVDLESEDDITGERLNQV